MVVSPGKNWDPSQDILPQSNIGLLTCCCSLTAIFSHFFSEIMACLTMLSLLQNL